MENLRCELVKFVKRKFSSDISFIADDIVNEAFLKLMSSSNYSKDKENFGYLSVTCLRLAYKHFMRQNLTYGKPISLDECSEVITEDDFVDEILKEEDTTAVLNSLKVLREIEKIVIRERYYGNFTFAEIARRNNLKLNTVLSHHRRALERLRPILAKYF